MNKKILAFLILIFFSVGLFQGMPLHFKKESSIAHSAAYEAAATSCTYSGNATAQINTVTGEVQVKNLADSGSAEIVYSVPVSGVYNVNFTISSNQGGNLTLDSGSDKTTVEFNKGNRSINTMLILNSGNTTVNLQSDTEMNISNMKLSAVSSLYEAEAGERSGYAQILVNDSASNGAVVTQIGGPNTDLGSVTFSVYAPRSGRYGVMLSYLSYSSEHFYVEANGEQRKTVNLGSSVDDSSESNVNGMNSLEFDLKEGYNRIRVYSDCDKVIDLDCMTFFAPREIKENIYEDSTAKLMGSATRRKIYRAGDGYGISNIGPDGSAEFTVNTSSGTYELGIWYSAAEYRALEVYVDNKLADTIYCPITGEDFNIETVTTKVKLSSGKHVIKFANQYSQAPDIDKIQLIRSTEVSNSKKTTGVKEFKNDYVSIKYDMSTGKAEFFTGGQSKVDNIESVVKLESDDSLNTVVKSSDYTLRKIDITDLDDGYGKGKLYSVISNGVGLPEMVQSFYVYDTKPYVLVKVAVKSQNGLKSNFLAPITAMGDGSINIGEVDDGYSLFVPYDNDAWVRYRSDAFGGLSKSYWATSVFDNTSRHAIVTGSVDHDTWKTGTTSYTTGSGKINFLGAFAGIWSAKDTYDYLPHGSLDGTEIASPKMFLGYYDDWRDGMEAYGSANSYNVPMLEWNDGGVPFGYNSWYGQGSKVNYDESRDVSDFIAELQGNGFSDDNGVTFVNLDSYWDSFSDEQLKAFVEKCHANNQKAGIYWSHFVFWATDMSWKMGVPGYEYSYRDAALNDSDGGVVAMAKDSGNLPLDPTSDAMKARLKYYMQKFVDLGFEYLKIDFLNYAAIEGVHADPNVKTGMQAYNQALKMFCDFVDPSQFFLSYSIAPLFPYQYAHARRISCDTAANIGEIAYMMNSLNFGWWEDDTLYKYNDPDHISFSASAQEARTRYNSAVITGTLMLLSDSYKSEAMKDLTRKVVSNVEVNEIAKMGKAFRPIEGNVGQWATDAYTLETEDAFYIAVFNFEQLGNKTVKVSLKRAGLEGDKEYRATDLWDKTVSTIKNELSVNLLPSESTIIKIDK